MGSRGRNVSGVAPVCGGTGAAVTYEGWRRLWLSGGDSNAIAALRFHGLRNALVMPRGARTHSPPLLTSASSPRGELPVLAEAVIAEAASQVRCLLRASLAL